MKKEAWIQKKKEKMAETLYGVSYSALCDALQGVVRRWAEYDYKEREDAGRCNKRNDKRDA